MNPVIAEQIVKPMERGQITLPLKIRKAVGITPQTWLWVKLLQGRQIVIEPVESKEAPTKTLLAKYVHGVSRNSQGKSYWTKEDDAILPQIP